MNRELFIQQLRSSGWTVELRTDYSFHLPSALAARYPCLPDSLINFLSGLSLCVNAKRTTWFLCQGDFDGTSGRAFRWDEWERLSLNAADDDPDLVKGIREFWDSHFPFMFSVHSGYTFHAVCTAADKFGQVVEGCEPEFEQVTPVADSFEEFLSLFIYENCAT